MHDMWDKLSCWYLYNQPIGVFLVVGYVANNSKFLGFIFKMMYVCKHWHVRQRMCAHVVQPSVMLSDSTLFWVLESLEKGHGQVKEPEQFIDIYRTSWGGVVLKCLQVQHLFLLYDCTPAINWKLKGKLTGSNWLVQFFPPVYKPLCAAVMRVKSFNAPACTEESSELKWDLIDGHTATTQTGSPVFSSLFLNHAWTCCKLLTLATHFIFATLVVSWGDFCNRLEDYTRSALLKFIHIFEQ